MKAGKWIVAATVMLAASAIAESRNELRLGLGGFVPSGDFWESSREMAVEWRHTTDNFLLGMSIGFQTAEVNEENLSPSDGFVTSGRLGILGMRSYVRHYEGDATMVPISGMVGWTFPFDGWSITMEGGISYVVVNADVTARMIDIYDIAMYNIAGDNWATDVEIGNNLLGAIGANLHIPISEAWGIFAKAGYQFDISKSDVEFKSQYPDVDGKSISESELGGFYAKLGVAYGWPKSTSDRQSSVSTRTSGRPVGIGLDRDKNIASYERELAEEKRQAEIARREAELKWAETNRKAEELRKAEESIKAEEKRKAEAQRLMEEEMRQQENAMQVLPPPDMASQTPEKSTSVVSAADMTPDELVQNLRKLKALRDEGLLTEEEYEPQRKELMKYYLGIKR